MEVKRNDGEGEDGAKTTSLGCTMCVPRSCQGALLIHWSNHKEMEMRSIEDKILVVWRRSRKIWDLT
jgi:hypothetical protein